MTCAAYDTNAQISASGSNGVSTYIMAGAAAGGVLIIIIITTIILLLLRRKNRFKRIQSLGLGANEALEDNGAYGVMMVDPAQLGGSGPAIMRFDNVQLKVGFSRLAVYVWFKDNIQEKLGQGNFGTVWRAIYKGSVVAGKCLVVDVTLYTS